MTPKYVEDVFKQGISSCERRPKIFCRLLPFSIFLAQLFLHPDSGRAVLTGHIFNEDHSIVLDNYLDQKYPEESLNALYKCVQSCVVWQTFLAYIYWVSS